MPRTPYKHHPHPNVDRHVHLEKKSKLNMDHVFGKKVINPSWERNGFGMGPRLSWDWLLDWTGTRLRPVFETGPDPDDTSMTLTMILYYTH